MHLTMDQFPIQILNEENESILDDPQRRKNIVFLDQHPSFPRHFTVDSFDPSALHKLDVGRWRAISVLQYDDFYSKAIELGYDIWFLDDPSPLFDWMESLNDDPEVEIISDFPGTYKGLLPFQIQAVNFMKGLRGSYMQHSTGTGKSISSLALTQWYLKEGFDLVVHVVKASNTINVCRYIEKFMDMDAVLIDGSSRKRNRQYDSIEQGDIVVTNYEKLRTDKNIWREMVEGIRVVFIFDEAPTKIKNRSASLYKSISEILYTSKSTYRGETYYYPSEGHERPSELICVALSATPVKKSPEDFFNVVRLLDPSIYGSVRSFRNQFVAGYNRWGDPTEWKDLDLMALKAAHIVHQVDKEDPDIAKQFPKVMPPEDFMVGLHPSDARIYDYLTDEYQKMIDHDDSILDDSEILAAINCLQMICASPRSVLRSADMRRETENELNREIEKWIKQGLSDSTIEKRIIKHRRKYAKGSLVAMKLVESLGRKAFEESKGKHRSTKILALIDKLQEHDGKAVVFTKMNYSLIPVISDALTQEGIEHVLFHGGLTTTQKQEAQDQFRSDPDCRVFLSSDSGSDSINLEMADLAIDFDEPYAYDTKIQRQNRIHRLTSEFESVRYVTIMVESSVEERTREVWMRKMDHHNSLFKGDIATQSMALRRSDLLYILTGQEQSSYSE